MSSHVDELNVLGKDGLTPLMRAVISKDVKQVEFLLASGGRHDRLAKNGMTAWGFNYEREPDNKTKLINDLLEAARQLSQKNESDVGGSDNAGDKGGGSPMVMVLGARGRLSESPSLRADESSLNRGRQPDADDIAKTNQNEAQAKLKRSFESFRQSGFDACFSSSATSFGKTF